MTGVQTCALPILHSFLELAAVADHSIEREGIEHPTSGTSFLEAVAILYVITIAAATADKMALFYIRKADKNIIKRMIDRCLDDFLKNMVIKKTISPERYSNEELNITFFKTDRCNY